MTDLEAREKAFFGKLKSLVSSSQAEDQTGLSEASAVAKLKANWIYWLGLLPVFLLTFYVRTRNLPYLANRYLIELDSYFWLRYAKIIYETGTLPVIDYMRYVPLGYQTAPFKFFPLTLAYMYKFIHAILPNVSQIVWHIYYPPIIAIVGFFFFFLFVRELFGDKTALLSTAFLAVVPAYIQRTSAGFADHEAMALLWMFASLWLFAVMWKSEKLPVILSFSALSAIFASAMVYTWGGYRYLTLSIGLFFILAVFLSKMSKEKFAGMLVWFIVTTVAISYFFSGRLNPQILVNVETAPFLFGILAWTLLNVLPKVKQAKFLTDKFTLRGAALLLSISIAILASAAVGFLKPLVYEALAQLFNMELRPVLSKFGQTVSESQKPQFSGGSGLQVNFGWFLLLSAIGAALLFYETLKDKNSGWKENKFPAAGAAGVFTFLIIFTLGSFSNSNALSKFFSTTLVGWAIAILALITFVFYKLSKKEDYFTERSAPFLLALSVFLVGFLFSHNQVRLLFTFAPVAAIASAFLITEVNAKVRHFKFSKYVPVILGLLALYLIYTSSQTALAFNRGAGPMVPGQWEDAMTFLREQTPENSVVAHWWDYGHMTIAIGQRAAVTDGGNLRSWNHDSARYFLTGKDKNSTLTYLKTHEVTHILISQEEIPKFPAYSELVLLPIIR